MFFDQILKIVIAFLAGIVTFITPCILPVIPSYISYISGATLSELKEKSSSRFKAFFYSLFFVSGFTVVYTLMSVIITTTFGLFEHFNKIVNLIAGGIVIFLGLNFIFDFWNLLNMEGRFHLKKKPAGVLGAFFIGTAFGAGWTPCVGPILLSILNLAATSKTGDKIIFSVLLLVVYSLGLGLPFLLTGLFFSSIIRQLNKLKPYMNKIKIGSGIFLIFIGLLILFGNLKQLNSIFYIFSYSISIWQETNPVLAKIIFGSIFLFLSLVIIIFYIINIKTEKEQNNNNLIKPFRIFFIVLFTLLSILSFIGVLNIPGIVASWFEFQGLDI